MSSNTPRAVKAVTKEEIDKQVSQAADNKELLRQAFELPNKSQRIRFLSERGVSTAEIAKMLGILYQHAYNVLHQTPKRLKTAVAHKKAPQDELSGIAKTKTEAEPPTLQPKAPSEFNVMQSRQQQQPPKSQKRKQ